MKKIDLHIHTTSSDGFLTPDEVVDLDKKNGCHEIAITDHDYIEDLSHLENKYNIKIIPGIEFNTSVSNLHLLGYDISDIDLVNRKLQILREKNEEVCYTLINNMMNAGYDISVEKISNYIKEMNFKSDMIDKRKIVKYLISKGYTNNTYETYQKLIGQNTRFYVPNYKISPEEIMSLVDKAGGISVLAHPGTLKLSDKELYKYVKELMQSGLRGIEVYNKKMESLDPVYTRIADELHLLKTVGSDFHDIKTDTIGISVDDDLYNEVNKQLIKSRGGLYGA